MKYKDVAVTVHPDVKIRKRGEIKMSKFMRSDVPLFVCKSCKGLDSHGKKDFYTAWRSRCVLCGRLMDKFLLEDQKKKGKKVMDDKKRFPRLLAANEEQKTIVDTIEGRTRDFDAPGKVTDIHVGPIVTEYEFTPDRFTRFRAVKGLNEDLSISLGAESVTVQTIPGKTSVSICIPNKTRAEVLFSNTVKDVIKHRYDMELPLSFGVDVRGNPFVEDLTKMPHLLVAGATGAGKSVALNNFIDGLLTIRSPKECQFVMVDPKSVELFPYGNIPHMWRGNKPVADIYAALGLMEDLIQEMRRRTANLNIAKHKNIKEYNDEVKKDVEEMKKANLPDQAEKRAADIWPYIVLVIDEMADLILQEKKLFTDKMATISAMARAAGIHVIAATQRPSVDVLSGKIKVNFPARAAFRMPQQSDSKTVLGHKGAEQLLGKGDLFLISSEKSGLQRLHAPKVTKEETDRLMKISIEMGHFRTVPADSMSADAVLPVKPVKNGQKAMVN